MTEKAVSSPLYNGSFELNPDQLRRLVGVIKTSFTDAGFLSEITFDLEFTKNRTVSLDEVEEIFQYPNNHSDPLRALIIDARAYTGKSEHRTINYDIRCRMGFGHYPSGKAIKLITEGVDRRWVNQLTNELRQEIEPTLCTSLAYRMTERWNWTSFWVLFIYMILICFAVGVFSLFLSDNSPKTKEIDRQTDQLMQTVNTLKSSEEKIDFLFKLRVLEIQRRDSVRLFFSSLTQIINLRLDLKLLLFLGLLAFATHLLTNYYPNNNFIWGDYEKHYQSQVSSRNALWTTVIIGFAINLLASVFLY
jgi:hypothetical protein